MSAFILGSRADITIKCGCNRTFCVQERRYLLTISGATGSRFQSLGSSRLQGVFCNSSQRQNVHGGFLPTGKGHVHTCYHEGALSATERITLYVCTYAVGHFIFQVVGQKQQGYTNVTLQPRELQSFAVEFWPWVPAALHGRPPRSANSGRLRFLLQSMARFDCNDD